MGDEPTFGITNVRFGVLNPDGTCDEWHPLGEAVSFDFEPESNEASRWADAIANLRNEPMHTEFIEIKFKSAMHRLKMLRDVFGLHVFTIRELKRYGKSTKRMRKARRRR